MDHSKFFETLTSKLNGKCQFRKSTNKQTYIHYRSARNNEVQVNITTRFEPKNTVRIQMMSETCPQLVQKRITTAEEAQRIEEALHISLTRSKDHKPIPSHVSHNNEYTYYVIMFPFKQEPMEVVDEVAETLIKIFNVLAQ